VARQDFATAYNVAIFSFTILIIVKNRLILRLRLLNLLYLLTIAFCIYTYHTGINLYGYLPGQGVGEYYERGRSLFPYAIVGSAFFSLVVLMKNATQGTSRLRWLLIAVCAYFVFFSYNRTSIICLLVFTALLVTTRLVEFQDRPFYRALPACIVLMFLVFVFYSDLFSSFISSGVNNESLEYLSSNRDMVRIQELSGSARPYLMSSQISLFLTSPLFGVGTFQLDNAFGLSGRETFLTGLLARIGLLIVPFVMFYLFQIKETLVDRAVLPYITLILLTIIMMTYGVIMVPYELLFLLLIGMLNDRESSRVFSAKTNVLEEIPLRRRPVLRSPGRGFSARDIPQRFS
jgi:hypothetical protein